MQGRRWFHAHSEAISWRHSTHVIESRGGSKRGRPVQSKSRCLLLFCLRTDVNGIEQFDVVLVIGEKPKIMVVVVVAVP